MKTFVDLENAAKDFCARVGAPNTLTQPVRAQLLADSASLREQDWATCAGVYVVLEGRDVRYVGRALKGNTLAGRLREHFRSPRSRVGVALSHPNAYVSIFSLQNDDAWLAPSLELLVLSHVRADGILNLKRS